MGYLLKAVQSIVGDQVNTNSEAARRGVVEDWLAYKYLSGGSMALITSCRPSKRPSAEPD